MLTLYILLGALYVFIGFWVATVFLIVAGSVTGMEIASGSTPPDPRFVYPTLFFSFIFWPIALLLILCHVAYKKLIGS